MTLTERMHAAVEAANKAAGKPDGEWNRRWYRALVAEGFDLTTAIPGPDYPGMMSPKPYLVGWAYPYPSVLVELGS